jgi:superfamily II DNA or RNA helicase
MGIRLDTKQRVIPMVYSYSTPQIAEHNGWTKIGYTEYQDVETRIKQQTHTSDTKIKLEWKGNARYDDGSGDSFTDKNFHSYLRKLGVENKKGTEWFHIDGPHGKDKFNQFRENRGNIDVVDVMPYTLRKEQAMAVEQTAKFYMSTENGEFLWNAKPRFGKTLTVYDFCKTVKARKVLIVTNRPSIANSWYSDYAQFMGDESGFKFVSETDSLKGKPYVMSRDEYIKYVTHADEPMGCIEFLSLQDLKGSIYFGGKFNKLEEVKNMKWDILVVDEAHEGVDTLKTDTAFEQINRGFTLYLSGTPFKALANDKFPDGAIYNWTYADEQRAKANWKDEDGENPYANLPYLNLYTYKMSEIVRDEMEKGVEINGETEEYAFDLSEFFETKNGKFVHDSSVSRFLDALTTQTKFPFSTEDLRKELKHTMWLLNHVESAKALAKKLEEHPVFSQYKIVLAAGDGKIDGREDESEELQKSFDKVNDAIENYDRTITLSVGQLTVGVTIPQWTAVLMLSNMKSPSLYMQAAFRAQNPCMFMENGNYFRKQNAYVFDFDPARTLTIFEIYANDLSADTINGKGDVETRKQHIRELLNFFPVIGEDENGEMIKLDAEKVLSIPRKIRSQEVVRRGFMSNYLFQNISGIFNAPQEVIDIISKFTPFEEPKAKEIQITPETINELDINPETGEVDIPNEKIIGTATELFGEKIYSDLENGNIEKEIRETFENTSNQSADETKSSFDEFTAKFKNETVKGIVDIAKEKYRENIRQSDAKIIEKNLNNSFDKATEKVYANYKIEQNIAENRKIEALKSRFETGRSEMEIEAEHDSKMKQLNSELQNKLIETVSNFVETSTHDVVKTVEKNIKEREKSGIEDTVRDHLRGFSRTIPSFLMAYGDDSVTLETFDKVIPDDVFVEVTSITIEQFRFLRDGGNYTDKETGEEKHFNGNLFDPVVFDDSVKEFLRLKKKLANYFDEESVEDIFDYIPPQKTNQIFTPKNMVKKMVDMLEEENPGCFDDSNNTFIDLYMKSGLYITEIVKRLYKSEAVKEHFPDSKDRLQHIFEKQVYGLAPTEIIYRIALSYILGFDETADITKHNFRQLDALPYAKDGTLQKKLDELFE